MKKMNHTATNIVCVLAFPVMTAILMELISLGFSGRHLFSSLLDVKNLVRSAGISALLAMALSFNIPAGRFDLSLGAQMSAAVIIGGNIGLRLGLGGSGMLICAMLLGCFTGLVVGGTFVTLKIPPMVLGVGMALVWECIAFTSFNSQGLQIHGQEGVSMLSNMGFVIMVVVIIALVNLFITGYTTFGYHHRAAQGSQKISHDSGINIFKIAVICYMFAGVFAAASGIFSAAFKGIMDAGLGLSTTGTVMANCFPLFLGQYIGKWCNRPVGILVACLTIRIYNSGLIAFNMTTTSSELVNILTFLLFLVFLANQNILKEHGAVAARVKEAKAMRMQLQQCGQE